MKIEVQKAQAFEIDPSKTYIVFFESETPLHAEEAINVREQLLKMFSKMGVKAQVVVTVKGHIKLSTLDETSKSKDSV